MLVVPFANVLVVAAHLGRRLGYSGELLRRCVSRWLGTAAPAALAVSVLLGSSRSRSSLPGGIFVVHSRRRNAAIVTRVSAPLRREWCLAMEAAVGKKKTQGRQVRLELSSRRQRSRRLLLWIPLRRIPFGVVLAQIAGVDRWALLAALLGVECLDARSGAALVGDLCSALGMPRPLRTTYPLSLIGLFFGQALPAAIGGDVVRAWLGCKTGLSACPFQSPASWRTASSGSS